MVNASHPSIPSMKFTYTTEKEIDRIIKSLKHSNSYGYDKITTTIIQVFSPYITSPLNYICNRALFTGTFPDRLKFATVRPLFKKGDKRNKLNYRPISLLPVFSKILERVVQTRLINHLNDCNILRNEQYGFRPDLNTDNATYQLTNEILHALNNKTLIGGIFCDLEKAFDCVNHEILLLKLKTYGITDNHYKLYKSYLNNRYQRTLICDQTDNAITSTWAKVIHGVPQGSILGPLLFLLFINDLLIFVREKSIPILFADDTCILISHSNLFDFKNEIKTLFINLNEWFKNNLLSLNFSKTQLINFTTRNTNQIEIPIDYNNTTIPISSATKFLGLRVDCTLSWRDHIDLITKKLSNICYLIRNIKTICLFLH